MKRTLKIVGPMVAVAAIVAGVGLWWFFRDDAPPEVSLEAATLTVSIEGDGGDAAVTDDPTTSPAVTDITGRWTVDTETGEFDYESATGSFVGFRIDEEVRGIGSTTAVGRTGDVVGELAIVDTTVTSASFEIDVTTITTNDSRRDDNVQDALATAEFPTATFTLLEPIDLGEAAVGGEPVAVSAKGQLTIHGVTRDVDFALEAQLVDETIVVVGSTDITFADYDVEIPTSGIILSVEDFGVLELQLLLTLR